MVDEYQLRGSRVSAARKTSISCVVDDYCCVVDEDHLALGHGYKAAHRAFQIFLHWQGVICWACVRCECQQQKTAGSRQCGQAFVLQAGDAAEEAVMAAAKAAAEAQKVVQMGQLDDLRASVIAKRCSSADERDRAPYCEELVDCAVHTPARDLIAQNCWIGALVCRQQTASHDRFWERVFQKTTS